MVTKTIYLSYFSLIVFSFNFCKNSSTINSENKKEIDTLIYLNHSDSAFYVGMNTCKQCHQGIYNTFVKTGMGKSFDQASKLKSSANFSNPTIYDKIKDLNYTAFWHKDSLFFKEYRLKNKDTTHQRVEQVNYIIGSGQHTNSHLQSENGYITQMPMTFYTQKKHWDLPPGFEEGLNTRFSRKIGLECMSCHNGYPNFVMGSENKYTSLPSGIDCERCHGPGSIHVQQRKTIKPIDTSKYIDYSIVNPAKLSINAQFDICQRCHLQGNAILKNKKSFYDFKPGQKLSDYISVFLPKYSNSDNQFIMASHADRLKQSACFIKSYEKVSKINTLKPYKDAMTCITCHNPHVSVKETNLNFFNEVCMNCHGNMANKNKLSLENAHQNLKSKNWSNCVNCHMPTSGATDIPHVTVHDHYIRKPITEKEKDKIKLFLGLFSINEKNPDVLTKAKAYINQYDKFDRNPIYLDSAIKLIKNKKQISEYIHTIIHLYFIKQDYKTILLYVNKIGEKICFNSLFINKSYNNEDGWAAYRIAEAYYYQSDIINALKWFQKAINLAPYNLDFRNKYGSALASNNKLIKAIEQFEFIINENPKYLNAYTNLGYIKLIQGQPIEALKFYNIGLKLDPDNDALLLNLAGYYLYTKNQKTATKYLEIIINKNPENIKAKQILKQLNSI